MGSLYRCNPKVSHLTDFISHGLMLAVILTLLSGLGGFQFLTNNANLLFCILDHVRAKELSLAGFRPVKRRPTFSSIKNFERGFAQASLITVVISELGEW